MKHYSVKEVHNEFNVPEDHSTMSDDAFNAFVEANKSILDECVRVIIEGDSTIEPVGILASVEG